MREVQKIISQVSGDFRFWIVFFFLVRLIGITYPPIEPSHNWRQAVTLSTARHFVEDGVEFLYPKTDIAGADKWNVIAGEFPFFNYLIYLVSLLFGYEHWYGRLINLVVSSWGIFAFYRFIKERNGSTHALFAGLLLLVSGWFMFSRKVMPDTFSCALVLIGVRQADLFFRKNNWLYLLSFLLASSLGVLVKLPATLLFILLLPLFFEKEYAISKKIIFLCISGLALFPAFCWYYIHVPQLLSAGAFQLYFPYSVTSGWRELRPYLYLLPERFYFSAFFSYVAAGLCLLGIVQMIRKKEKWLLVFILSMIVLGYFILKTGSVFALHDYYVIPFVPFMAWCAGFAAEQFNKKKWWVFLAVIAIIESLLNQQHDFRWNSAGEYKLRLEAFMNEHLDPGEPLAILSEGNPSEMYFSHRSGWLVKNADLTREKFLHKIRQSGCRYLLFLKEDVHENDLLKRAEIVAEEERFGLFSLNSLGK